MENYEYSKTYPFEEREENEPDPIEAKKILDFLDRHEKDLADRPKFLLPYAPALFEKTVADCEQIVKEFSGRIEAKVDYDAYTATIDLWCLYVEFNLGEFMDILHEITNTALSIKFMPLTSGDLHIEILMPYFLFAKSEDKQK